MSPFKRFFIHLGFLPALILFSNMSFGSDANWSDWVNRQSYGSDTPVVQNKQITQEGRFQIMGPGVGIQERKDLYNTYSLSLGGRYHFTDVHGWEIVRFTYSISNPTHLVNEIQEQTSYVPDIKLSKVQLSTSYIFSPIYGKYAWNSDQVFYFNIYGLVGGGVRFSDSAQPFGEVGLGSNHYIFSKKIALTPELRWRFYSEQRSSQVFVLESLIQLGVSWLL